MHQSARLREYADAHARLIATGHVYPCYETPEELVAHREAQRAEGRPPLYDRAALALSDGQKGALVAQGRAPYWRFRLGDIEFGVSQIVRGEDYLSRTSAEIQLFEAIGARAPKYAHHSRLAGGPRSLSVGGLRERGAEPMALNSYLAKLCSSDSVEVRRDLTELKRDFDLAKLGRATASYDAAAVEALGRRFVHGMSFVEAAPRLHALGLEEAGEAFWYAVRGAIGALPEALDWWRIVGEPITPLIEDPALTAAAADLLPDGAWSRDTWLEWTVRVAGATGRTGRDLYRPLRLALTGRGDGPEMQDLLPLVGQDRAAARLRGRTA